MHGTAWLRGLAAILIGFSGSVCPAQYTASSRSVGIFFPSPAVQPPWSFSIGIHTFTTPQDLTEEVRVRIPALDLHALRRLPAGFSVDARLLAQVLQNHLGFGVEWAAQLSDKFTFGAGDELAYWRGNMPIQGFDAKAHGWMNYPSVSLGFRSRRDLLFTAKGELLITMKKSFTIEGNPNTMETDRLSGYAFSLFMEQPFFKRTQITLGFTLAYAKFMWATWSLFQTFDRALLYPQITTALLL
jgi:hypothetical protein